MNVPKLRFKEFDGEWEYHKFSDEIKLLGGATPLKSNKAYWNGDIVWLSSQEIKAKYVEEGTYKITQKAIDDNTTKMVKAGTPLIVSRSGILARMFPISMPTVDVAINQDIKALIFDKEQLDTDFLVGQLQAKECFILKSIVKTGTTVQSVNIPDLEKMKLSIPSSFKEQKKIGLFFKMIDEKIQLHQQKIDLLQEQKKGYMQKVFKKELSFSDKSGQRYQTWVKKSLKEVADSITYGMNASAKAYDGENIYLRITDIDEESRSFIEKGKVSPSGELSEKYLLKEDDILFTRTGASTGKSFIFKNDSRKFYFAGFLIRVRIKEIYNSEFIYQQTLTYSYNKWVKIMSMRSGQPGINGEEFGTLEINVPCMEEQKKISNFLALLDKRIKLQKEKVELLKIQKQGFMQQMFI